MKESKGKKKENIGDKKEIREMSSERRRGRRKEKTMKR